MLCLTVHKPYSCCHLYKVVTSCSNVKKIGKNTYQQVLHYLEPVLLTLWFNGVMVIKNGEKLIFVISMKT